MSASGRPSAWRPCRDAQASAPAKSFKALSAEALQSSMAQLTELARAQLQTAKAKAKGELEQRRRRSSS